MLDPETGESIEEFHDRAADEFAKLATDWKIQGSSDDGVAPSPLVVEEGGGSGAPADGSDAAEEVSGLSE